MAAINIFAKELKYQTFSLDLIKINDSEENSKEKQKECIDEYINFIREIINNSSFEKTVAIIDFFNNRLPAITNYLLETKDEKIIRAALVLEKLNDIEPSLIKNELENVKKISDVHTMFVYIKEKKYFDKFSKIFSRKYEILNDYLKDKDNVDEITKKDLEELADNLDKVDMIMFSNSNQGTLPRRSDIINTIFSSNISVDTLSKIYSNVLSKNPYLKSFDYDEIIISDEDYIGKIKGLYRKADKDFFELFSYEDFTKSDLEEVNDLLNNIGKLNEDDHEGLLCFFGQIKNRITDILDDYLMSTNEYYKKYSNDLNIAYEKAAEKLLNGNSNVDSSLIEYLGSSKSFKDNYYDLLDKFIKSNDEEYQNKLLLPLTIGLVELQKEKYGLSYDIVYTTNNVSNDTFGYYNTEEDIMYINPFTFEVFSDKKAALACACNVVFHETRHALQKKELGSDKTRNFDNLMMAMDFYLSKNAISGYYQNNYQNISYEKDARNASSLKVLEFFKDYEEMYKYLKNIKIEEPNFTDLLRKDLVDDSLCILNLFMNTANTYLSSNQNEEELKKDFGDINKYPVIWQFFDLDIENIKLKPKSEEFFMNRLQELKSMEQTDSVKEEIHSIESFMYLVKVNKYMEDNAYDLDFKTDEEKEQLTNESIGNRPKR